jgi:ABC-type glutathione transport system ATPase component
VARKAIGGFWRSLQQQLGELLGRLGEGGSGESVVLLGASRVEKRPAQFRD